MSNLVIILPLTWKSELSGKFQRFNAIDGSNAIGEMLKNSWISKKNQLKWKIKKEVPQGPSREQI